MSEPTPSSNLGRHVYGVAVLAAGVITLVWHAYNGWHQPRYVVYAAAVALILGGAAMQFRRAAKMGAIVVGAIFLVFALQGAPGIVAAPRIYNSWGNFFEQLSLMTGAVIVYGCLSSPWSPETPHRIGRILLGICTASFALEQAIYLPSTASLVPKWIPPGQMFWAVTTTVFSRSPRWLFSRIECASRGSPLTMMLVFFGLLVWVAACFGSP